MERVMRQYRCLVVEDSETMRNMLAESLARIPGMLVVEAENGLAGIRALATQRFDLVVTDVNMPVMDGLKLISLIRGEENLKQMPIVVITTEGATEDRERALSLGADEYLTKPIQANRVLSVAKSMLKIE